MKLLEDPCHPKLQYASICGRFQVLTALLVGSHAAAVSGAGGWMRCCNQFTCTALQLVAFLISYLNMTLKCLLSNLLAIGTKLPLAGNK